MQDRKHLSLRVHKLHPQLFLRVTNAHKERLVLRPRFRAGHGRLQLAEDRHLFVKADPRAGSVRAEGCKRRTHFIAACLEHLDGVRRLARHVLNPCGLALRFRLLLKNAVHGAGVGGHGRGVGLRRLCHDRRSIGKGREFLAGQPGNAGLNGIGGVNELLCCAPITHGVAFRRGVQYP